MNKSFWKILLRPYSLLRKTDSDYIAEVSTVGRTLHNDDIAKLIIAEGSEIKYDTLLSIINQVDRIKADRLVEGYSIQDTIFRYMPRIKGRWSGINAKFDQSVHSAVVSAVMSKYLRLRMSEVRTEMLGMKGESAYIGLVTDLSTGIADGLISPDGDIAIEGDCIKIAPEGEEGLGVFLVPVKGGEAVQITRRLTVNGPKKIVARVPGSIAEGEYRLRIVTRFSRGIQMLLADRVIEYDRLLTVRADADSTDTRSRG